MGNGMNKILPGLYVGNFRDSRDEQQLKDNKITHILSIHDNAKATRSDMIYLCINARDVGYQDLAQYFSECNDFIHSARIYGGNVLVHCLAGMSRSVTITVAYIMTVTSLGWRDALGVVRASRQCASPNFGFQKQLLSFQHDGLSREQGRLYSLYPNKSLEEGDKTESGRLLKVYKQWVLSGDGAAVHIDEKTYPLPHRAYSNTPHTGNQGSRKVDKSDTSAQSNDCSSDHQSSADRLTDKMCQQTSHVNNVVGGEVDNSASPEDLLEEIFDVQVSRILDHTDAKCQVAGESSQKVSPSKCPKQNGLRYSNADIAQKVVALTDHPNVSSLTTGNPDVSSLTTGNPDVSSLTTGDPDVSSLTTDNPNVSTLATGCFDKLSLATSERTIEDFFAQGRRKMDDK